MRWTSKQYDVLRAYRFRGAEGVQKALLDECGAEHTIHAIEQQACRIGVSLKVKRVCPECGAVDVPINRISKMCPRCTAFYNEAEEEAFNLILEMEAKGTVEGPEIEEATKRYAMLRQRNSRLIRKHGLTPKKVRDAQLPTF